MHQLNIKINHIALWVKDLQIIKSFYEKYFNASASELYINPNKNFKSYFLKFDGSASIEIMSVDNIGSKCEGVVCGYAHSAMSVGSKKNVDLLTQRLKNDGYNILSEPRITGDGYYESVIADPENNIIEITE